jgi:hypothetical protein
MNYMQISLEEESKERRLSVGFDGTDFVFGIEVGEQECLNFTAPPAATAELLRLVQQAWSNVLEPKSISVDEVKP